MLLCLGEDRAPSLILVSASEGNKTPLLQHQIGVKIVNKYMHIRTPFRFKRC